MTKITKNDIQVISTLLDDKLHALKIDAYELPPSEKEGKERKKFEAEELVKLRNKLDQLLNKKSSRSSTGVH